MQEKADILKKVEQILLEKETIYQEEFEMIYSGASVEEVVKAIDKKEKEKQIYQEKAKKEALEEHKTRDIKSRIATAEALEKAGVISKKDLEKIKAEANAEFEALKQAQAKAENEAKAEAPTEENKKQTEAKDNKKPTDEDKNK